MRWLACFSIGQTRVRHATPTHECEENYGWPPQGAILSFDEFVELLRERLFDADAIDPDRIHSFMEPARAVKPPSQS